MKHPLNIPRLIIEIVFAIALAEAAVMFILPVVAPGVDQVVEAVLDAVMLSIIAGPVIVWRVLAAVRRAGSTVAPVNDGKPWGLIAGAAGVLVAGLVATGFAARSVSLETEQAARARFEQYSERLVGEATRRVTQPRYGMAGARGVFAASTSVDRRAFEAYVASRNLPKEFPGAIGFGFIQRVKRADLDAFVAAERADGAPDFAVHLPPGIAPQTEPAPDLYVIKHCFPKARNAAVWGLDAGSDPIRREAAERAAASGQPALSRRTTLWQDGLEQEGFIYLLPVYKNGSTPTTPEERMAALVGLVYTPIILGEALAGAADEMNGMLDFEIFDGERPTAACKLFDLDAHLDAAVGTIDGSAYAGRMFHRAAPVNIGGRTWTFVTSSTPAFDATVDQTTPAIMGVGGAVLSLSLAGVVWMLSSARARAVRLAESMTVDLAAAKAASERLAEIARRTSNAVVIADAKGCVEWVNEGFTRITGYTLEEAKGRKPGHLLQGPATDKNEAARVGRAVAAGTPVTAELVNYHKSGRAYTIAIEIMPSRNEAGEVTGFMAIESDVTERIESQRRLAEAKHAAEAANAAKSAFLANMSHEIRTPLTAILGFADVLCEDGDLAAAPEHRLATIDTIRRAGNHLLTVINDILDLSKIEADKMTVERVQTPLAGVLREVESLVRPRAAAKGVALDAVLATPVPEHIMSDPTRLRQMLLNLLGNAAKFTDHGSVTLRAAVAGGQSGAVLHFDVEDTGPGMTPEQAARLFEPFGQADDSVTRKFGGTGLGLTICRRLSGLMGGTVELLRTEPGMGSCFRLSLPLEPVPGAALVTTLQAVATAPADVGPVTVLSGRILLAEDGPDNQRLIAFHLKKAGAAVTIADNGRIALKKIETAIAAGEPFDLLLTDIQMPEMDGYTLARTLRQSGTTMPIIALTAHAMAEDRAKCVEAGCDDYTSKPIDKGALLATCSRWLEHSRAVSAAEPHSPPPGGSHHSPANDRAA